MHALIDGRQDHERQDHERRLAGKADQVVERAFQVGPNPRRQHDAQRQQHDDAGDRTEQNSAHLLPFPPAAHPRQAEHSITLAELAKGRQPTALATLAAVFAALPLAGEPPMPAAAIHARVATWSESCTGRCLRELARAGLAEQSLAPAVATSAPANLYRRSPVRN